MRSEEKCNYLDIKNRIETIIECNLPIVDKEYRDLLLNSIMTTLRDSGLHPTGFYKDAEYKAYCEGLEDGIEIASKRRQNNKT